MASKTVIIIWPHCLFLILIFPIILGTVGFLVYLIWRLERKDQHEHGRIYDGHPKDGQRH